MAKKEFSNESIVRAIRSLTLPKFGERKLVPTDTGVSVYGQYKVAIGSGNRKEIQIGITNGRGAKFLGKASYTFDSRYEADEEEVRSRWETCKANAIVWASKLTQKDVKF